MDKVKSYILVFFEKIKKDNKQQKYIYMEIMRIVAIIFVIFNHTINNGFFLFSTKPIGSIQFWVYLSFSVFCKFSVPLFFMISVALLLGKDEPIKKIWIKRVSKMIIVLIVFSFVYYLNGIKWNLKNTNIIDFLKGLYTCKISTVLWYIYAYIGYLISLPFLRSLVRNLKSNHYYYMMGIALLFIGIIPCIDFLVFKGKYSLTPNFNISWLISIIVLYPCLGYFLQNQFEKFKDKKVILLLWILNFVGIIISCYMTFYKAQIDGIIKENISQKFHSNFALINCTCMFISIRYIFENIKLPNIFNKIICSLGSCVFGIYLFHVLIIRDENMVRVLDNIKKIGINSMIAVFIWCLLAMLMSYVITFILKKIPGIKKIL
jgi:surface polysaccharide O-acyltransferase-like enzyme